MDSSKKERKSAIKFYIVIFICAFIVAVCMYKPVKEPQIVTNEWGEIVSCSVCDAVDVAELADVVEEQKNVTMAPMFHDVLPSCKNDQTEAQAQESRFSIHGRVIKTDEDEIKHALVEYVELYPKEHAESNETITRKGMLVHYPGAKGTILVCHGFMCDRFDVGLLRQVFAKDYNIMTFDFRAHGENREGQYCTFGRDESQDVIAAARFLRNHPHLKDKPLFVYGFSMGAAASIEAQSQVNLFDAMILDCPFDSTENVIKRGLNSMKFNVCGYEFGVPGRGYLEQYAFHPYVQSLVRALLKTIAKFDPQDIQISLHPCSPVESVKNINIPCFFIHCKNDEKVPLEAVKEVFAGANGPKKLWITNGRRHFDSYFYNPEKYVEQVKSFLKFATQGPDTVAIAIDNAMVIEDKDHATMHEETIAAGEEL